MAEDKKRMVKNPETFRERALKSEQSKDDQPKSRSILFFPFRVIKAFFSAIGKQYTRLSKVKGLKPLFVVLNFTGKIIFPPYFRNSLNELKGVTWPSGKQSIRLTYAVLAFAVIFGLSVAIVDYGLDKVFKVLLLK